MRLFSTSILSTSGVVFLWWSMLPRTALAACDYADPTSALQVFPADEASDVVSDLQRLWVFAGFGWTAEVDFGELGLAKTTLTPIVASNSFWYSFELPSLESEKTYEYTVHLLERQPLSDPPIDGGLYGPFRFTVGRSPALAPAPPEVATSIRFTSEGDACMNTKAPPEDTCSNTFAWSGCFDTAPWIRISLFMQPDPNTAFYAFGADPNIPSNMFAASCPVIRHIDLGLSSCETNYCLNVTAYGHDGLLGETIEYCEMVYEEQEAASEGMTTTGDSDTTSNETEDFPNTTATGGEQPESGGCSCDLQSSPHGLVAAFVSVVLAFISYRRRQNILS